jgi:hypothetical protein
MPDFGAVVKYTETARACSDRAQAIESKAVGRPAPGIKRHRHDCTRRPLGARFVGSLAGGTESWPHCTRLV